MNEVVEFDRPPVPALTPMALVELAVRQNAGIELIDRILHWQERNAANDARQQFVAAITLFKATPLEIRKNKRVSFTNRQGTRTDYMHATLDNVCGKIIAGLSAVGISHKWTPEQTGNSIKVTCVLTHKAGHSESTSLAANADESGGKNNIQAIASTVTYLERYTLLAATGLSVKDQDDDGAGAGRRRAEPEAVYRVEPRAPVEGPTARETPIPAPTPAEPAPLPADGKPMADHQRRIILAKLTNAGLNERDLQAQFGKPINDASWTFSDFERIQDWIKSGKK